MRYPTLVMVSIAGGSPSLRRSRLMVTWTVLVNGSIVLVPYLGEEVLGAEDGVVRAHQGFEYRELFG